MEEGGFMLLSELRDYNARLLQTNLFKDYCPNGVQVEGRAEVRRIATGVTASQQVLDDAIAWGADAILVHHGYFWRNEDATIVGIKKNRIAELLRASNPAPSITPGLEVLVQLVMAAMTTEPWQRL
jgi:putative NIF3 family GTP cyclohydrolase 1 type 2